MLKTTPLRTMSKIAFTERLGQNPTLNRKTSGVLPSGKFPLVF